MSLTYKVVVSDDAVSDLRRYVSSVYLLDQVQKGKEVPVRYLKKESRD